MPHGKRSRRPMPHSFPHTCGRASGRSELTAGPSPRFLYICALTVITALAIGWMVEPTMPAKADRPLASKVVTAQVAAPDVVIAEPAPVIESVETSEAAVAPEPVIEAAPAPAEPPTVDDFLACVRHLESTDDYAAYNPAGPYYGGYQFLQSTWDATAAHAGRDDLIGLRPNQASPADQDFMAAVLLDWYGPSQWSVSPACL